MKTIKVLASLLLVSFTLNVYQFIKHSEVVTGGGIYLESPDETMEAWLQDLEPANPLQNDSRRFGKLLIRHGDHEWFSLRFSPTGLAHSGGYRDAASLTWSDDSQLLEARAPYVFVKVDAKRLRERHLNPNPGLPPSLKDSPAQ